MNNSTLHRGAREDFIKAEWAKALTSGRLAASARASQMASDIRTVDLLLSPAFINTDWHNATANVSRALEDIHEWSEDAAWNGLTSPPPSSSLHHTLSTFSQGAAARLAANLTIENALIEVEAVYSLFTAASVAALLGDESHATFHQAFNTSQTHQKLSTLFRSAVDPLLSVFTSQPMDTSKGFESKADGDQIASQAALDCISRIIREPMFSGPVSGIMSCRSVWEQRRGGGVRLGMEEIDGFVLPGRSNVTQAAIPSHATCRAVFPSWNHVLSLDPAKIELMDPIERREELPVKIETRAICPAGYYYAGSCKICNIGNYCPGNDAWSTCNNAPPTGSIYTDFGATNSACPFKCTDPGYFSDGISHCITPVPIGKYSNGSVLHNCTGNEPFVVFTSGAWGLDADELSCNSTFLRQCVVLTADGWDSGDEQQSLTVELWLRIPSLPVGLDRVSLVELAGRWSLCLSMFPNGGVRLELDNIETTVAIGDMIPLDQSWHHVALVSDSSLISFYLDGQIMGIDIVHEMEHVLSSFVLSLGSQPSPFAPSLFTGLVDDVRISWNPLPPWLLGAHNSAWQIDSLGCSGWESNVDNSSCLPRCPLGTERVDDGCQCSFDQDWVPAVSSCHEKCPSGQIRGGLSGAAATDCMCPANSYKVWGFQGARYLTLASPLLEPSSANCVSGCAPSDRPSRITLKSISLNDGSGNPIAVKGCSEGGIDAMNRTDGLCQGLSSGIIGASLSRGWFRVTLDLGLNTSGIAAVFVDTRSGVEAASSVQMWLSSVPVPVGPSGDWEGVWGRLLVEQVHLDPESTTAIDDRSESELQATECALCPINMTGSVWPGSSMRDCQCIPGRVHSELDAFCVPALPAPNPPVFSLQDRRQPKGAELTFFVETGAWVSGWLRMEESIPIVWSPGSPPIVLNENATVDVVAKMDGHWNSALLRMVYDVWPVVASPSIWPWPLQPLPRDSDSFVSIGCATTDATVYWTLDGSDPLTVRNRPSSSDYGSVSWVGDWVRIKGDATLRVIATHPPDIDSREIRAELIWMNEDEVVDVIDPWFAFTWGDDSCVSSWGMWVLCTGFPLFIFVLAFVLLVVGVLRYRRWVKDHQLFESESEAEELNASETVARLHASHAGPMTEIGTMFGKDQDDVSSWKDEQDRRKVMYTQLATVSQEDEGGGGDQPDCSQCGKKALFRNSTQFLCGLHASVRREGLVRLSQCDQCTLNRFAIDCLWLCKHCHTSSFDKVFLCKPCDRMRHEKHHHPRFRVRMCLVCREEEGIKWCKQCKGSLCEKCLGEAKGHKKGHEVLDLRSVEVNVDDARMAWSYL